MRKTTWLPAFAAGFLSLLLVPDPGSPQSSPGRTTLSAVSASGLEATLFINEKTEILVMASWCPVSHQLNSVLKDERARPYLKGKRLFILFDYEEFQNYYARRVQTGEVTQAQIDEYVRNQPRGPLLVNPEFLSELPTDQVFFFDAQHPVDRGGFPSAYSGPPNEFHLNWGRWLTGKLGIPRDLKEVLLAAHPLAGGR